MTASFTMSELMCQVLGPIPENKPSLLQKPESDIPAPLTYYQNNILGGQEDYYASFVFLKNHFFLRIEWARLWLSFKKLFLFQESVKALGVKHTIGERVQVLSTQLKKIMKFPASKNPSGVCAFLGTIGITYQWIPNYLELTWPLSRLTGKINWRWTQAEQLSFELLKIKSTTVAFMYKYNPVLPVHLYTDASRFAEGLVIMQFRPIKSKKELEVPIVYNSFTFFSTQRKYVTYKRELCTLTRFVIKYDYLCKHPLYTTVIYTDHKPLTHFLKSDTHKGIYRH